MEQITGGSHISTGMGAKVTVELLNCGTYKIGKERGKNSRNSSETDQLSIFLDLNVKLVEIGHNVRYGYYFTKF